MLLRFVFKFSIVFCFLQCLYFMFHLHTLRKMHLCLVREQDKYCCYHQECFLVSCLLFVPSRLLRCQKALFYLKNVLDHRQIFPAKEQKCCPWLILIPSLSSYLLDVLKSAFLLKICLSLGAKVSVLKIQHLL